MVGITDLLYILIGTVIIRFLFNISKLEEEFEKTNCYFFSVINIITRSFLYPICDIKYFKEDISKLYIIREKSEGYNNVMLILAICFIFGVVLMDSYLLFLVTRTFFYEAAGTIEFLLILLFVYNLIALGIYYFKSRRGNKK